MTRLTRISAMAALLVLLGLDTTFASDPMASKNTPHVSPLHRTSQRRTVHEARTLAYRPAQAGMVIAWDPESHTFTMPGPIRTLPLTAAEQNALSRSFAGLVQVHHPDGSVSVDLQGRFQEFAVVHLGPDGKPVYRCLDDTAAVRRALHEPTTASGLEER